jgi:hypothetical protein
MKTRGLTENLQTTPGPINQPAIPLRPALLLQETCGSLKFPSLPYEHMPGSTTTVVFLRQAPLRQGIAAFRCHENVSFPRFRGILLTTIQSLFRSSIAWPAFLIHPALDFRCRICPWISLPVWWRPFNRVGIALTGRHHPVSRNLLSFPRIRISGIPEMGSREGRYFGGKILDNWSLSSSGNRRNS